MEFRDVWEKVGELEGQTFRTDRGEEFSYRFRKTYVVVSLGGVSVPRTNFEKVFRRSEQGHAGGTSVQGERFIMAIFRGAGAASSQDDLVE
jgi:hypothetical protein